MEYQLKVKPRAEKASAVRAAGNIPGVVYGPQLESQSITLSKKRFLDVLEKAGESTLINCEIEGRKDTVAVLVQDIQRDPVKGDIVHVDLRQVNMAEKIDADIQLVFQGEAPAVKAEGGVLVKNVESVSVRCLPKDLVSEIVVPLDSLNTFDDVITVADIKVPAGMEFLSNQEDVVAKVIPQRTEKELAALEEKPEAAVEDIGVEGEKQDGAKEDKKEESKEDEQKENKKE